MGANKYKVSDGSGKSLFSFMENMLKLPVSFENGVPVRYLPKVLFVALVLTIYIGNTHYADNILRRIDRLKVEVEDLRADYTTLKSDYMFASKQSEIAQSVKRSGIIESVQPPYKIVVKDR